MGGATFDVFLIFLLFEELPMQLGDHFPLKSQILKRTGVASSQ